MQALDFNVKHKTSYCISTDLRDEQVKINCKKVSGRVEPHDKRKEPCAIVGFAPSLQDTWEEIKKFEYIFTCSGAHKFLLDKGLKPSDFKGWWHLDLDPREHKIKLLGEPQQGIQYLIASTIHPKYLDKLSNYDVKLWHIFADQQDSFRLLPRGEWSLTGGADVGMRTMSMARFLGFTTMHIFGCDGCKRVDGTKHADYHPNTDPTTEKYFYETELNGKKFIVTPALLECAKSFTREIQQLADVNVTFYGEGLTQEIYKCSEPNKKTHKDVLIGFNKPELISDEYVRLNSKMHQDYPSYGMGGGRHVEAVLKLIQSQRESLKKPNPTVLDYGAGKKQLEKALGFPIWNYDPAIPEICESPKPADLVLCFDVLEHIETDKLNFVLDDLARCVLSVGYFVISTRPAVKKYANGRNAHLIIQPKSWWEKKLSKFFTVASIEERKDEVAVLVGVKAIASEFNKDEMLAVSHNGRVINFLTPNKTTKWRVETLLTKEPSTIEWLDKMKEGKVLFDVGANMGIYSIYAAAKGIKVFSFEPEFENYALMSRNFKLNKMDINSYCMAISDKNSFGHLFVNEGGAGQACHSFGENLSPALEPEKERRKQGCVSMTLDDIVNWGLPTPDYIKIDVDGLEYNVIKGATHLLNNGITGLLVEINENLPQHHEMIDYLCGLGFTYNKDQVDRARRKEGTFKGVAEYIFEKNNDFKLSNHVASRVAEAKLNTDPYKYVYVENIFPDDVYKKIIESLKGANYQEIEKTRGTKGYPKRFTGDTPPFLNELLNGKLKRAICDKFDIASSDCIEDLLLIKDYEGYSIPPHTDSLRKIVSALFYLPVDNSIEKEGTSIYIPKKKDFICTTGQHHKFEDFEKVWTAPFAPNSALIFMRTDNSFHGVEPSKSIRDVLLYNINKKQ